MIVRLSEQNLAVVRCNQKLEQYLNGLLAGKPFTPRSWLYENVKNTDQILDTWLKQLSQLEKGSTFEQNVYNFDISQLEKWGPQGGVQPINELLPEITSGFGAVSAPSASNSKLWKIAKQRVAEDLAALRLSLRPRVYSKVVLDMRDRDTLESNSGWPLFERRNMPQSKEQAISAAYSGDWKTYPAIALFRNYNQKTRLVWMYPMAVNVKEGSYLQPLQQALIERLKSNISGQSRYKYKHSFIQYFMPWLGFDDVRKQISDAYSKYAEILAASDFSETDKHFTKWHTQQVYDVIKVCFQPIYHHGLHESLMYMHEIPLVIGPDKMITGDHGVSSGSNWTNFVETIFDQIFAEYVLLNTLESNRGKHGYGAIRQRDIIEWRGLSGIGDDMCWAAYDYYNPKRESDAFKLLLQHLAEEVGHIANADKTTANPDKVKYLQRLFQRGYKNDDGVVRAVYSTVRALKSSVYPERMHKKSSWNSDMFCARQYMILENCVDHPLFKQFCLWVAHGQKDLIPFAHKDKCTLDRIWRETKLIPGLNPTYNQEKKEKPLSEYESVKTVRENLK